MRTLIVLLCFTVFVGSGFGIDFGLNVDEAVMYETAGVAGITNNLKTTLWTYIGNSPQTVLNARITYTHQAFGLVDDSGEAPRAADFPYMFDVEKLTFGFNYPDGRIVLGRYMLTEPTRSIVTHKVDGISLRYSLPALSFSADLGYTGLLWKNASAISPSLMDIYYAGQDEVVLGSPRVIGVFSLRPPVVFGQTLRIGAIVQEDLRRSEDLMEEGDATKQPGMAGLLDTQYLFAHLSGPVLPILYYTAFGAYGTGRSLSYIDDAYGYSDISSFLLGGRAQFFLKNLAFSLIQMKFQYGSGDEDATSFWESNAQGNLETFISLTGASSGIAFRPQPGNIILGELSYSIKPGASSTVELFRTLQIIGKGIVFFRPKMGYISEAGVPKDATERYLGSEVDVLVNARPFSDLGFSLAGGVFFPSGAFVTETGERETPRITLRATMSLSM